MRRVLRTVELTSTIVLLAACGSSRDEARTASAANVEKVLHVYNGASYVAESTVMDFEARTGIKAVNVHDSDEVVLELIEKPRGVSLEDIYLTAQGS